MTEELQVGNQDHILFPLLNELYNLDGDIVEFGVYAGRTTEKLAASGRTVWALDTFTGIPQKEYMDYIDMDTPGKFAPPEGTIERLLAIPNIRMIPGRFSDTLPTLYTDVVLAYIDCDLMISVNQALHWLEHHMVDGGAIVLDDYMSHRGVRAPVDLFVRRNQQCKFNGTDTIRWRKK